jgi:hypothetical protein
MGDRSALSLLTIQGNLHMQSKHHLIRVITLATAFASMLAYAGHAPPRRAASERMSADMPRTATQRMLAPSAHNRSASMLSPGQARSAAVTDADVGDSDSFGRNVVWLGLTSAFINLDPGCPFPGSGPDDLCQTLAPAPAVTSFNYPDAARIQLPAKATHSLLCYWFSPVLNVFWHNPTASPVIGRLRYNPTLTLENPVLDDPALIDPTTGAPFAGKLLTSMTSSERFETPLAPGVQFFERTRDSAVCMAGLISRRALVDTYGLTDAQATQFFKKPTMVRLNVSGSTQFIDSAGMIFGLRIVGD